MIAYQVSQQTTCTAVLLRYTNKASKCIFTSTCACFAAGRLSGLGFGLGSRIGLERTRYWIRKTDADHSIHKPYNKHMHLPVIHTCAWLPLECVTMSRHSGGASKTALHAPRALKEPVF